MPDNDDPFTPPDATMLRPRPGRRQADAASTPARPRAAAPSAAERGADSDAGARAARHRPEPARAGGEPAAAARRPAARTLSPMDVAGLRRHALDEIRRFEEQARAAGVPNEIVLAARYALCAGLDEAVLSTPWGSSERMGAAAAAGGAAPRGVGRREVLRHARPDLAGSGAPHRSDGAAVSRASRSASPASTRCRSAGTSTSPRSSRTSTARSATIAARRSPSCRCAGADSRIGAIR